MFCKSISSLICRDWKAEFLQGLGSVGGNLDESDYILTSIQCQWSSGLCLSFFGSLYKYTLKNRVVTGSTLDRRHRILRIVDRQANNLLSHEARQFVLLVSFHRLFCQTCLKILLWRDWVMNLMSQRQLTVIFPTFVTVLCCDSDDGVMAAHEMWLSLLGTCRDIPSFAFAYQV